MSWDREGGCRPDGGVAEAKIPNQTPTTTNRRWYIQDFVLTHARDIGWRLGWAFELQYVRYGTIAAKRLVPYCHVTSLVGRTTGRRRW